MIIWEFIKSNLKKDKKVMLMVVIDSQGSSPGRRGFKMAIVEDGKMNGSIGGGLMEYNLVELAKKQFDQSQGIFIKRQNHNSEKKDDSSGMICSGNQVIAFYLLDKTYFHLIESIAKADSGQLIFNESGFIFNREINNPEEFTTDIKDENKWSFTEQMGFKNFLYIFGAGHVSLAVSRLFKQLGFHITVFDNRDRHLTTFKNNSFAHSKRIINYNEAAKYAPEGDNIYVIIVTYAHKNDSKVLQQLINKKIKYLGMMGSDKKIASVFKKLENEGVTRNRLNWVDAPIGLPINSQTPDEIAVSIAAKIISVKSGAGSQKLDINP